MKFQFINDIMTYDGTQLRSHFIFGKTGILGDSIVSFVGPADVPLKNMVDLADVAAKENIYSTSMVHFIVEHFDSNLDATILKQRLLSAIAAEELWKYDRCRGVERKGDDLYDGEKKLSVSIATASPVSCLIHFAINIKCDKTPCPTKGLSDYDVDPRVFADAVMAKYVDEMNSAAEARCKVRAVE